MIQPILYPFAKKNLFRPVHYNLHEESPFYKNENEVNIGNFFSAP